MDEDSEVTKKIFKLMVRLIQAQVLGAHYIDRGTLASDLTTDTDAFSGAPDDLTKLSFDQVRKMRDANPTKTVVVILQSQSDIDSFSEEFKGDKKVKILDKIRWYPLIYTHSPQRSSLSELQERLNKDKDDENYVFLLAAVLAVCRLANIPGQFRDKVLQKLDSQTSDDRVVFKFREFKIPDAGWNDTFDFITSSKARTMHGDEDWKYLDLEDDKNSDGALKSLSKLSSILTISDSIKLFGDTKKALIENKDLLAVFPKLSNNAQSSTVKPSTSGRSSATSAKSSSRSDKVQKIPTGTDPFVFQTEKNDIVSEAEKLKEEWATKLIPLLVAKVSEPYQKNNKTAAQILENLSIAAGKAASKKTSVYNGTVFNIYTRRLLKRDNKDGRKVIGEVLIGDELGTEFEGARISLAVDLNSEDPYIPWFEPNQVIPGEKNTPQTNRTANNSDLGDWIRTRILPGFWKQLMAIIAPEKSTSKKLEVNDEKDIEARIRGVGEARKDTKTNTTVKRMARSTVQTGQDIGFAPRWAALLPILAGEEESVLSNNMIDLRNQSFQIARDVLRLDKDDLARLEDIRKTKEELFSTDDASTIDQIRSNYEVKEVDVKASDVPFEMPGDEEDLEEEEAEAAEVDTEEDLEEEED